MSLIVGDPTSGTPFLNLEPGVVFATPPLLPDVSSDGFSVFANQTDIATQTQTAKGFFPLSPDDNYTGPNKVTIGGHIYVVTPDNYSAVARQYIEYQRSQGNKQYDDKTPAQTGTGEPTTSGNLATIALADAMRQIAGLKPVFYSVDPLTGVAIPDNQQASNVLNNPVFKTADAISNAGTSLFNSGTNLAQGLAQGTSDVFSALGGIGNFLKSPGGIFILAGGALAVYIWLKKR